MVMPDLLLVFLKRWKLILLIIVSAIIIAFIVTLLSPKKFLATATALPANSMVADKARIFNQNIQELYSDFGSVDELDKLEGTGKLDTLFIAASEEFKLDQHYKMGPSIESVYDAALQLKKDTKINRSGYGELKVKVWDGDKILCAQLANFLMKKIRELHQHLQNESNVSTLAKIKEAYALKEKEYMQLADSAANNSNQISKANLATLADQLQTYQKMIDEYQLAIDANAPVLLVVENARVPLRADRPRVMETILFVFFGSFFFSFLLALFIESRKTLA
jgi:hypothetical protein